MKKLVKKVCTERNALAFFVGIDENSANGVIGKCQVTTNNGCNVVSGCS